MKAAEVLGSVRAGLAELTGRTARRDGFAVLCVQCGRSERTVVYRLGRRSGRDWGRYWCRGCGAVAALTDPGQLRPAQWPQPRPRPVAADQSRLLAPPVRDWLAGTGRPVPAVLDKAAYYQVHKRFDAVSGLGLPPVSVVVGRLHEFAYQLAPVVQSLLDGVQPADEPLDGTVLAERVRYARAWLAHAARDTCWVLARFQTDLWPDPDEVAGAAARLAETGAVTGPDAALLRAALFGVDGGPNLRLLLRGFTESEVTAAVAAYRVDRTRPLLAATRAALDTPPEDG